MLVAEKTPGTHRPNCVPHAKCESRIVIVDVVMVSPPCRSGALVGTWDGVGLRQNAGRCGFRAAEQ
jgi:hypothetical protein